MGQNTKSVTDQSFQADVLGSDKPVLVDFWAEWCGPCRALGPTIDALADSYGGRVKVGKLNVDEHPAIAARYGVRSIPTVIVFADGAVQDTIIGGRPQQHYASKLDSLTSKA